GGEAGGGGVGPPTPAGHRAPPARPGKTGPAATPMRARAARATARPAANSARRTGSAVAIAAASAGNSFPSPGGPKDSAATTPAGRMSAIIFHLTWPPAQDRAAGDRP